MSDQTQSTKSINAIHSDMIIALLALLLMANYYYGVRTLVMAAIAVSTCVLTDIVCVMMRKKRYKVNDLSAVFTGLVLALLMPATVSFNVLIFSSAFSIIVGKQVFGGKDNIIFNPAAVGYAFAMLCWSSEILLFPKPFTTIPIWGEMSESLNRSLGYSLNMNSIPAIANIDIWLGRFVGPIGATHVIVLIVCAITLMFRRSISTITFLSGISTSALIAYLFPRVGASAFKGISLELVSGVLLFGMIFMASDPSTMPKTKSGRLWQGILIAIITFAYRHFGNMEHGFIFALLIANPLSDALDNSMIAFARIIKVRFAEFEKHRSAVLGSDKFRDFCVVDECNIDEYISDDEDTIITSDEDEVEEEYAKTIQ